MFLTTSFLRKASLRTTTAMLALAIGVVGCAKPNSTPISADLNQRMPAGIIGGTNATSSDSYSKNVVMLYNMLQGTICTASILSDSVLVTAAHCVEGPASVLRLVFGTDFMAQDRVIAKVDAYSVSPLWPLWGNNDTNAGDIAVIVFSGGLPPGFQPAKILSSTASLKKGDSVLLAGYGVDNGAFQTGSGTLRSVEISVLDPNYSQTELLLDQSKGKGACHGDSGGPAFAKVNGEWLLWGVTNRAMNDPNNTCAGSVIYASIPFYKSWLMKTAQRLKDKVKAQAAAAAAAATPVAAN